MAKRVQWKGHGPDPLAIFYEHKRKHGLTDALLDKTFNDIDEWNSRWEQWESQARAGHVAPAEFDEALVRVERAYAETPDRRLFGSRPALTQTQAEVIDKRLRDIEYAQKRSERRGVASAIDRAAAKATELLMAAPGSQEFAYGNEGYPTSGMRALDVAADVAGNVAGFLGSMGYASPAAGAVMQAAQTVPVLGQIVQAVPGAAGGAATALVRQGVRAAGTGEMPSAREVASDVAFLGGAGLGGQAAGMALARVAPGLSPYATLPAMGAAAGATGALAAAPFKEKDKTFGEYVKEAVPGIISMAVMHSLPLLNSAERKSLFEARSARVEAANAAKEAAIAAKARQSEAFKVLGLDRAPHTKEQVSRAFREQARMTHPDVGGSQEQFQALNAAKTEAMRYVENLSVTDRVKAVLLSQLDRIFAGRTPATTQETGPARLPVPVQAQRAPQGVPQVPVAPAIAAPAPQTPAEAPSAPVAASEAPARPVIPTEAETPVVGQARGLLKEAPVPVGSETPAKEPWQMTREEFAKVADVTVTEVPSSSIPIRYSVKGDTGYYGSREKAIEDFHRRVINSALDNGLDVPKNVLDEYPDIVAERRNRQEYQRRLSELWRVPREQAISVIDEHWLNSDHPIEAERAAIREHRRIVQQALSEGKPVPQEVLADYPDLVAKQATEVAEQTPSVAGFKVGDLVVNADGDKFTVMGVSNTGYELDVKDEYGGRHWVHTDDVQLAAGARHPLGQAGEASKQAPTPKASAPMTPAPSAKEPWQMTWAEYQATPPPVEALKDKGLHSAIRWALERSKYDEDVKAPVFAGRFKGAAAGYHWLFEQERKDPTSVRIRDAANTDRITATIRRPYGTITIVADGSGYMRVSLDRTNQHAETIAQALSEGKPVPPEVLKDYPDLAQQAPTAKATPGDAKEPWQMTKAEFYAPVALPEDWGRKGYTEIRGRGGTRKIVTPDGEALIPADDWGTVWVRSNNPSYHRAQVSQALSQGKPVPPEVLADYPDLAKQAQVAEAAPAPAVKEPWQMTREEFLADARRRDELFNARERAKWPPDKYSQVGLVRGREMYTGKAVELLHSEYGMSKAEATRRLRDARDRLARVKGRPVAYSGRTSLEEGTTTVPTYLFRTEDVHEIGRRYTVERALSEGKPVPPEVLADYPDLTKKAPGAATPAASVEGAPATAPEAPPAGAGLAPEAPTTATASRLTTPGTATSPSATRPSAAPEGYGSPRAAPLIPPSTSERAVTVRVPVDSIKADPERFQFKQMTDKQGTTGLLKNVNTWDDLMANAITVWEDKNGQLWVVNGHHRLELAKRLGRKDINVNVLREADGVSARAARVIGAKQNMAEGRGTAVDVAKLVRDEGLDAASLHAAGVSLAERNVERGLALAGLQDWLFNNVATGKLPEDIGVAIGRQLPGDADAQNAVIKMIESAEAKGRKITGPVLEELIRTVKGANTSTDTVSTLFGEEVFTKSNALEKAELIDSVKRDFRARQRVFKTVNRAKMASLLEEAGNILRPEANARYESEAELALDVIDKLAHSPHNPVSDILNKWADDMATGGNPVQAKKAAFAEIARLMEGGKLLDYIRGKAHPRAGGIEEDTGDQPGLPGVAATGVSGKAPARPELGSDVASNRQTESSLFGETQEQRAEVGRQEALFGARANAPVVPTASTRGGSRLAAAQEAMASEVDRVIEEIAPPGGLSIKITNKPGPEANATPNQQSQYAFSDPETEARWKAANGIPKTPLVARIIELKNDLIRATREYEHLPQTVEFAPLRYRLRTLQKQKGVASDATLRLQQGITVELNLNDYDLFTRKVILDDLAHEADKGRALPFGFTEETLAADKAKIDAAASANQKVANAVAKRKMVWDAVRTDYIKWMEAAGVDISDRLTNEDYFRHQVLEYARLRGVSGTGQKVRTPVNRGFLKRRSGSDLDINTNYIQAEYEVMAQMLYDIEVAKTIKLVNDKYNIADQVKVEAKAKGLEDWHAAIPEGYTTWQPRRGSVVFLADSIPAQLADKIRSGALQELGIAPEDVREVLAIGGLRREFVVKQEVADTLDNLTSSRRESGLGAITRTITSGWKKWQLINPRRWFKYNVRNLSGDAEAVFVGNPSAFLKAPQAARELYQVYAGDRSMTPTMRDWFARGGMESTLTAQEISDVDKLRPFLHLMEAKGTAAELPLKTARAIWNGLELSTKFRESVLRYAAYLDYLEQMSKDPNGRPRNFGASIPEEVMALDDIKDRAFQLSDELLGAYDEVSVLGKELRQHLLPFWSWQEVNFKRYIRMMKNAARDRRLASTVGRKLGASAPRIAYNVGKFVLKALGFTAVLSVWNNLPQNRDEEEDLPDYVKNKPHIVLGRDSNGQVRYFDRLGMLQEFLEWFGLDEAPSMVRDFLNGRKTIGEIAKDMAKAPVNKVVGLITPLIKAPAEALTRHKLYPDALHPTHISDPYLYLAEQLSLGNEYKALKGLPSRGYGRSIADIFVSRVDPGETAYNAIRDAATDFLKQIGKYSSGYSESQKSNALYNLKLALRYGDKKAVQKYLFEYARYGGTQEGLRDSLDRLHPLGSIAKADRARFLASLDDEQRKQYEKALEFYQGVILESKNVPVQALPPGGNRRTIKIPRL